VSRVGEIRNTYRIFVVKPKDSSSKIWTQLDNIKLDLRGMKFKRVDWIKAKMFYVPHINKKKLPQGVLIGSV